MKFGVAPSSIKHLIGQAAVMAQVAVALDAAFADNRKFDHALLTGPPGLGKSGLAEVIAKEMATDFHRVFGQSIACPEDLNGLLLAAKSKHVIFIDEVHELKKEYQTSLYLALDHRKIVVQSGATGRPPESIPTADFTLVMATTDEFSVLSPLRDRMKLILRFDFYEVEELTAILWSIAAEHSDGAWKRTCSLSSPNAQGGHLAWHCGFCNRAEG